MSRTALTTQDHIYSIEYFAMNNPAFEKTHYDVIQLIEQKKLGELIDKEKYLLTRRLLANLLEPITEGQEENSLR